MFTVTEKGFLTLHIFILRRNMDGTVRRPKVVLSVGQICADLITDCEEYPEEDAQVR